MDIESISGHVDDPVKLLDKIVQIDEQILNMANVTPGMNRDQIVALFRYFNPHIEEYLRLSNLYRYGENIAVPAANRISLVDLPDALDRIFLHELTEDPVPVRDMSISSLSLPSLSLSA